jgi:hypothetical protein
MNNIEKSIFVQLLCLQVQLHPANIPSSIFRDVCGYYEDAVLSVAEKFKIGEDGGYYNERFKLDLSKREGVQA